MLKILIEAIRNRKVLKLTFSGIKRVVQPYAVGVTLAGREVLLCYQVEGDHIDPGHQWNLMDLAKISHLVVTNQTFDNNALGYRKGDTRLSSIYAEV